METEHDNSALSEALVRLESFLIARGETFWAGNLRKVRDALKQEDHRTRARIELDSYFGGMGSLNDLYFENKPDQAEFERLADAVFQENRLFACARIHRLTWWMYSLIHRGQLPPRIRNGFQ